MTLMNPPTAALADLPFAPPAGSAEAFVAELRGYVGDDLQRVAAVFDRELDSDLDGVRNLVRHVERFRGKMLRPTLVTLVGRALSGGDVGEAHVTLAAVVEMVHMATLVHDDVLDEAEMRRKGPTLNHLRGNEAAVMLGDFLISHSYHLCASLGDQAYSRAVGRATNRVCEGELLQINNRTNLDLDERTYFDIISRKTGALTAVSCRLGAMAAGATDETVKGLERFGLLLGQAFQIQDDVLDLTGDAETVGKTLGIDVEKQKLTLPLIHFLRTAPAEHRSLLRGLYRSHDGDKAERVAQLIAPSGSLRYAREVAEDCVAEARACLDVLPESRAKATLDRMAAFVTRRDA